MDTCSELIAFYCVALPRLQSSPVTGYIPTADGSLTYCGGRLPLLSRNFKDSVAYPMLQFAMQGQ